MHTQQALSAFDAAVTEVGVRNIKLADGLRGAFVRRLAALGSAPDGWRLAPVEPAAEMLDAARDWSQKKYGQAIGNDGARGCYAAMLAAAPQPPAAQHGEEVAPDDEDVDRPTIRGCIETIKQAHDESLEGEHASARVMLRDVVADLEQIATQPAAAPQPVAQGDDYGVALLAAWDAVRDPGPAGDDVPHPVFAAGFKAGWSANAAAPAGVVGEPVADAYLVEWQRDGKTWVVAHASYTPAADEAARMGGTVTELFRTAPPARQALTDEQRDAVLLSVIQKLNSNPYSLTKSECISEVQSMRSSGIGGKGETA